MELDPQLAQRLVDRAPAIILMLDVEGRVLYSNGYMHKLSGYSVDEIRARGWFELLVSPRDRLRLRATFDEARLGDRSTPIVGGLVCRDGRTVTIEWSVTALDDGGGGALAIGHDLSQRRSLADSTITSEGDLRRSEAVLHRAQAIAHLGSFVAHRPFRAGDIAGSNELLRILDWTRRRPPLALRSVLRVLLPEDRANVIYRLRHAARTNEGFRIDCRVRRTDGTIRFLHVEIEPESPGTAGGWIGIAHDITERRNLEQEIARAQRLEAVGTLTAGLAHDHNNLLMGIIGCIDLAERHSPPDSRARHYLREARTAAKEGASLVAQLVTFARPRRAAAAKVHVDSVVTAASRMFRSILGEQVQLELSLAVRSWVVQIARSELDQVLMNLVVNARDAMPDGGLFIIRTDEVILSAGAASRLYLPPGEYVRLRVSDTGAGMDAETAARVFDPFFTTKPPERGTGLGLATVHGIIGQAGGHVGIDSKRGEGTTVDVHLPRARGTGELPRVDPERPRPSRRGSETILVVTDEPLLHAAVHAQLEPLGYRLLEATSTAEALRTLEGESGVALVLLEEGSDGSDTVIAQRLRSMSRPCPVVFMADPRPDALGATSHAVAGAQVLLKPFTARQLIAEVAGALDGG